MNFTNTVLRLLTIVSAFGLSGDLFIPKNVTITGKRITLEDGSEMLFFNCSSQKRLKEPYAEFLVNNKSVASSTYNMKNRKCNFKHSENNCTNKCRCDSDGKTFTWTFPLQPHSKMLIMFSCHVIVVNKTEIEQSHIWYDGTDFHNTPKDEESTFNIYNLTTAGYDEKNEEEEVQEHTTLTDEKNEEEEVQEHTTLTVPLVILVIVLALVTITVVCVLIVILKKHNQDRGQHKENVQYRARNGNDENVALLKREEKFVKKYQDVSVQINDDLFSNTEMIDIATGQEEGNIMFAGHKKPSSYHDELINNKETAQIATQTSDEPTERKQTVTNSTQTRHEDFKDVILGDEYGLSKLFEEDQNRADELCSICIHENIAEISDKLCIDCGAALCSQCNIRHLKHPLSTEHTTCDKKTMFEGIELLHTCKIHGSAQLDHICRIHNEIMCLKCMTEIHKQCPQVHLAIVAEDRSSLTNETESFYENVCEVLGLLIAIQIHLLSNMTIITNDVESSKEKLEKINNQMPVTNAQCILEELQTKETFLKSECHENLEKVSEWIAAIEKHKEVLEFTKQHCYQKHSYVCMLQIQKEFETLQKYTFNMKNNFARPGIRLILEDSGRGNIKVVNNAFAITSEYSTGQTPVTNNILKYEFEIQVQSPISTFEILPDKSILCVDGLNSKLIHTDEYGIELKFTEKVHTPYDISVIPNSENVVLTDRFEDILMFIDQPTTNLSDVRIKAVEGSKSCAVYATTKYIVLGGQKKINLLNHKGEILNTTTVSGDVRAISCFDAKYYYVCFGSNKVFTVHQNGDEEIFIDHELKAPVDIEIDDKGKIFVLDKGGQKMYKFLSCGVKQQLLIYGLQKLKKQIVMRFSSDFGEIYVLNNGGTRLSIFSVN